MSPSKPGCTQGKCPKSVKFSNWRDECAFQSYGPQFTHTQSLKPNSSMVGSGRRGSSSVTPIPAPVPAPAAPKQQTSVQDKDDNDNEFEDNPNTELNQKPASPHSKQSKSVGSAEKGTAGSAASNGLLTAKHATTAQPNSNIEFDDYGDDTHSRKGSLAGKILARDF